jgi:tRNA/rRNA methyltransferase
MALTAFCVLENALIFNSLSDALADIHLAFGTTRRFGKYRKNFLTPAAAGEKLAAAADHIQYGLVLGPEDTGLETKDLDQCQHFITIPTHDGYPSMNLSHALAVLLYEISVRTRSDVLQAPAKKNRQRATGEELEHMFAHMRESLINIEYLDRQNPDHLLRTFRRIFGTSELTSREVRIIQGLMSRIDWTENQRRKHTHVHDE